MAAVKRKGPVAVLGLGCIGGSLARALVAQDVEVRAWALSAADRAQAEAAGIRIMGDDTGRGAAACAGAWVIVVAVPIERYAEASRVAVSAASSDAVILHACGLQRQAALGVDEATHERVLGTHPLAGSHETGFAASRPDLFVGSTVSVERRASPDARERAEWLWRVAGAERVEYRDAETHDRLMAWVSHLPQLASTALAATLAGGGIDARAVGTGARDATRLAASALGSWPALLRGAPRDLRDALAGLERAIAELRAALDDDAPAKLEAIWERGRAWRRSGERRA
ncbi:MAG TPA: prephenate dehydrogenase/arogenate dehydrogenase family protein [Gemmatimonadaceae bacterium]